MDRSIIHDRIHHSTGTQLKCGKGLDDPTSEGGDNRDKPNGNALTINGMMLIPEPTAAAPATRSPHLLSY